MFTTFATLYPDPSDQKRQEGTCTSTTVTSRPKRHQVSRACVWCRTYRIKCDASYPCHNCRTKGRICGANTGKDEVRTYPLALKEIERLKDRVKELEERLKDLDNGQATKMQEKEVPVPTPKATLSLPVNLDPLKEHGGNKKYYNWDYVSARTARSNQQCYGPSSSFYFIGQMTSYLDTALQQRHSDIQHTSPSQLLSSPVSVGMSKPSQSHLHFDEPNTGHDLALPQEEYFLSLFWQSYHCIYPVLDEAEFKAHHKSLWETSASSRQPSAIVDILLAICMQHEAALTPQSHAYLDQDVLGDNDASIAGRWFYRRCQSLLADELEGPSITTLQCHLFSVIWLSNASFQNNAHSILAIAIRTGIILGLHLEPLEDMPKAQKEFRKRLWWTLYALEMTMGMELGRPLALNISQVTCGLPEERCEPQNPLHPKLVPVNNNVLHITNFSTQFVKLILATRAIYIMFYHKCADVLGVNGQRSLYHDPEGLESCAEFLLSKMPYLKTWLQQVPHELKTKRKNRGQPFSTDRSLLDIHPSTPNWLSRQCLFLELLYHNHSMSLYRPFICFSQVYSSGTPLTEGHAISCVNHAITITSMINQMITETGFLNGWPKIFQWQWNATLSLIGYILAYPTGPSKPAARKAVSVAITTFELVSNNFASATSAANVARDLSAKADLLVDRFEAALVQGITTSPTSHSLPFDPFSEPLDVESGKLESTIPNPNLLFRLTEDESAIFQNALTNSSGFAFAFDSFNGFDNIGTEGGNVFDFLDFDDTGGL